MESTCWRCVQKREHLREKLDKITQEARKIAEKEEIPYIVVQISGSVYEARKAGEDAGLKIIKYVSSKANS
jgi:hypothetical protein